MARYTGPKTKISRIYGEPILGNGKWLSNFVKNKKPNTLMAFWSGSSGKHLKKLHAVKALPVKT